MLTNPCYVLVENFYPDFLDFANFTVTVLDVYRDKSAAEAEEKRLEAIKNPNRDDPNEKRKYSYSYDISPRELVGN